MKPAVSLSSRAGDLSSRWERFVVVSRTGCLSRLLVHSALSSSSETIRNRPLDIGRPREMNPTFSRSNFKGRYVEFERRFSHFIYRFFRRIYNSFKTYRLNDSSLEESPKSKGKRLAVAKKQHCVMCKSYCTARKNVWVRVSLEDKGCYF